MSVFVQQSFFHPENNTKILHLWVCGRVFQAPGRYCGDVRAFIDSTVRRLVTVLVLFLTLLYTFSSPELEDDGKSYIFQYSILTEAQPGEGPWVPLRTSLSILDSYIDFKYPLAPGPLQKRCIHFSTGPPPPPPLSLKVSWLRACLPTVRAD